MSIAGARVHGDFLVPDMHCAGCMAKIERGLAAHPAVIAARANLTTRRVGVDWQGDAASQDDIVAALAATGFKARPAEALEAGDAADKATARELLLSLAIAGFAAGNIMLLSVSVWSGAEGATRDLFHWISALIALPAVLIAGRPFYRSAWRALSARSLNMDVPISLAVLLAAAMSLYETIHGGAHAYFDASVTLLFFLLVGRTLDHRMRGAARSAAARLMSLRSTEAMRVCEDGTHEPIATGDVAAGMVLFVAAGERLPADGRIVSGHSDLDRSLITGEAAPEAAGPGADVQAGVLNLTGPLTIEVTAAGADTMLAGIVRLMEAAERGHDRYRRLADRAAQVYAPAVHIAALATFAGWMWVSGGDWHASALPAIAVLIITCPCALGLAVPAVQVVASGILFRRGVMIKQADALEKLGEVDTVVFDKTGTLTRGAPRLVDDNGADETTWALAAGLAAASRHPLSRALADEARERGAQPAAVSALAEHPGHGVSGTWNGQPVRLGRGDWCGGEAMETGRLELWLKRADSMPHLFQFEDAVREDTAAVVAALRRKGLAVEMLSGDRHGNVAEIAGLTGIERFEAECTPEAKVARLNALAASGAKVLMVGDGLNDAPSLAAAHVSISPSTAADISQTAAGIVFMGERLDAVILALEAARAARARIIENFALAALYNMIAVPVAMAGLATPLVAAIAMSSSSLVVTGNALRLRAMGFARARRAQPESRHEAHAREVTA